MKLHFFGETNLKMNERLSVYLFSLLPKTDLVELKRVNKTWEKAITKTQLATTLIPTLQRIPDLANLSLAYMTMTPMSGGMTNCSFKINHIRYIRDTKIKQKWVLRIPGEGSSIFITRKDEAHNAKQASDLNLNVTIDFFDAQDGLQLTRFLGKNKTLTNELVADNRVIKSIAQILKCLHLSSAFHNTVPIFQRNQELLNSLTLNHSSILPKDVSKTVQDIENLENLLAQYAIEKKPCHNDTTPSNFLLSSGQMVLIDWEYSGNNDFIWDLVYFALEAKLSRQQEMVLLGSYFGSFDEKTIAWFDLYKPVIEWWITIWSWTQIANKANACDSQAYEALATTSYMMTNACFDSEAFKQAFALIEKETFQQSFAGLRGF